MIRPILDRFKDQGWVTGALLCTSMNVVVKNRNWIQHLSSIPIWQIAHSLGKQDPLKSKLNSSPFRTHWGLLLTLLVLCHHYEGEILQSPVKGSSKTSARYSPCIKVPSKLHFRFFCAVSWKIFDCCIIIAPNYLARWNWQFFWSINIWATRTTCGFL